MTQIKDVSIVKSVAGDTDYLVLQTQLGATYRITKSDFLAGLTSGGGGTPPSNSIALNYSSDGDDKGLFYYLGSNAKQSTWSNPHPNKIQVSSSSILAGSLEGLVNRANTEFYSNESANNWVEIYILSGKLKCNGYSIQNRFRTDNDAQHSLRNWRFQATNNKPNWIDLDIQINNNSLVATGQWLTLPINSEESYCYFRLLQDGVNSSGSGYLCLSELELYGNFTP